MRCACVCVCVRVCACASTQDLRKRESMQHPPAVGQPAATHQPHCSARRAREWRARSARNASVDLALTATKSLCAGRGSSARAVAAQGGVACSASWPIAQRANCASSAGEDGGATAEAEVGSMLVEVAVGCSGVVAATAVRGRGISSICRRLRLRSSAMAAAAADDNDSSSAAGAARGAHAR